LKLKKKYGRAIFLVLALCLPVTVAARMGMWSPPASFFAAPAPAGATPYYYYDHPGACFGHGRMGMMCHGDKFREWEVDQHARAWTGDFMVAQYYDLARPDGDKDSKVEKVKRGCVGCHSPGAYMALGDALLHRAPPRPALTENAWNMLPAAFKDQADRGIFCDFCHTLSSVGIPPADFNFTSAATAAIDPKRGPMLMTPGHGHRHGGHGIILSPLHDDPMICGTCHDETSLFRQKVKGTYTEWLNSPYYPATRCQDCHQRSGGMMRGMHRRGMYSMNFKGGFSPWVEGVASLRIDAPVSALPGSKIDFMTSVINNRAGHEFPSGSEEERQLWLHVTAHDEAGRSWHIPVTTTPDKTDPTDPNHIYWVTTNAVVAWPSPNSKVAAPIARDALPEGDRLYHSIFISPAYTGAKITYAQYYADRIYSNRLKPGEPRVENYSWNIPPDAVGSLEIRAALNYRRMPDSMADYLKIMRRPIVRVSAAGAVVTLR